MSFILNWKRKSDSDADLVRKYRETGDPAFMGELFQRYTHLVFGVCMKYFKNAEESKDGVMDIFEKLLTDLKRHDVQNVKPWLYFVAKNHCLMKLRKEVSLREHKDGFNKFYNDFMEFEDAAHLVNGRANGEEIFEFLNDGIDALRDEQKQTIKMFYLHGMSYHKISEITGYSLLQVKSFLQNGKRNLKIYLQERYGKQ